MKYTVCYFATGLFLGACSLPCFFPFCCMRLVLVFLLLFVLVVCFVIARGRFQVRRNSFDIICHIFSASFLLLKIVGRYIRSQFAKNGSCYDDPIPIVFSTCVSFLFFSDCFGISILLGILAWSAQTASSRTSPANLPARR